MPKIKAIFGHGKVIPVDQAWEGTAYRCPWTNEIFGYKEQYVKHLQTIREYTIHRKIRADNKLKFLSTLWNLESFEEIIAWLTDNSQFLLEQVASRGLMRSRDVNKIEKEFKFWVTHLRLNWDERVSNSHNCPHNGVTNWGRCDTWKDGTPKPHGYPGWQGRIEFRKSHDTDGFTSDLLKPLRIHTGTGGGNSVASPAGYEVIFFDADWPGLAAKTKREFEAYSSAAVMCRLKNEHYPSFKPTYNFGKDSYFGR